MPYLLYNIEQLQTIANLGSYVQYWQNWKGVPKYVNQIRTLPLKIIKPKVCDC